VHSLGFGALFKDDDKGYKRPDDGSVSRAVGSCIGQNDQQLSPHVPRQFVCLFVFVFDISLLP